MYCTRYTAAEGLIAFHGAEWDVFRMAKTKTRSPQNRRVSGGEPTRFKPGQSGNPGGRPKTAVFSEQVRQFLREQPNNKTRLRAILERLEKRKPEVLLHYAFGKPIETVDLSGGRGGEVEVERATLGDLQNELRRRGVTNPLLVGSRADEQATQTG